MAKDRARDPKRVPHLGIGEPMSHVKVVPAEDPTEWAQRKYGAEIMEAAQEAQTAKEA